MISDGSLCVALPIKSVRFSRVIRVRLIPCRGEYINTGMFSYLWWDKIDFCSFNV